MNPYTKQANTTIYHMLNEEIKNEIIDLTPLFGNKKGVCVLRKEVFEILDKYNNQPDYKSAWNELKNQPTNYITKYLDKFGFVEEKTLNKLIEELETKYNLGGE